MGVNKKTSLVLILISVLIICTLNNSMFGFVNQIQASNDKSETSRGCREVWKDTFNIESRIESKKNVIVSNGDVILNLQTQFSITSTVDFDAGIKTNIETKTDNTGIPNGEIHIEGNNTILAEGFEGPDEQDLISYDPSWTLDQVGSSPTAKIDTDQQNFGSSSVRFYAIDGNDRIRAERKIVPLTTSNPKLTIYTLATGPGSPVMSVCLQNAGNKISTFFFWGGAQDIMYYNGSTSTDTGYNYQKSVWYKIWYILDFPNQKYDVYIDGGLFNNFHIVDDANFVNSATYIDEIKIGNWDSWSAPDGASYVWYDNLETNGYQYSAIWESAPQLMPTDHQLEDTTITYSNLAPGVAETTRIEWRVNNVVKAVYDINITNDGFSPFTISDYDLTFGTFKNIKADFKIKIFLLSDGNCTPIIKQIHGNFMPLRGHIISTPITLYQNEYWDELSINKTVTNTSFINISVLDASTNQIILGYENLTGINIDLKGINPRDYLTIKLRANFDCDGVFFPMLHDWAVSWEPDNPKLIQDIPSNYSFDEDTNAEHLIYLGFYFQDLYDGVEDLTFLVNYESDPSHIDATVDGYYLDFTSPTENWTGFESFRVECQDTSGLTVLSNDFEVTVNPVNDAPVWNITTTELYMEEDEPKPDWIDLEEQVYDVENDQLDFKILSQTNKNNIEVKIDINNRLDVEPDKDYCGENTFVIQVYEVLNTELNNNITFTVIVEPVNDPPKLEAIETQNAVEDSWCNFTVIANDPDEGDILIFGSNITELSNFNISSTTGEVSFLPTNDDVGTLFINISVHDIEEIYDFENIMVIVANTNDPPPTPIILVPDNNSNFETDKSIDFIAEEVQDVDVGDILTYSWDFDDSDGIRQDATGRFANHTYLVNGTYTITLTVSDGEVELDTTIRIIIDLPLEQQRDKDDKDQDWLEEYWWILIVILIIIVIAIAGLIVMHKKKKSKSLAQYISGIETLYNSFKNDPRKCEEELERIRKMFLEELKNNKIDKQDFTILNGMIDEYLRKLRPGLPGALRVAQAIQLPTQSVPLASLPPTPQPQVQYRPELPPSSFPTEPEPQKIAKCYKCGEIIKVVTSESTAIVKCPKCGEEGTI